MTTQEKLQRYLNYLAQDPDNVNLLLDIAVCYQHLEDWQSALEYLRRAEDISAIPLLYTALLAKAAILHHLQKTDEAIELLTTLMKHPESTAEVPGRLAILYFDNNDLSQAAYYSNEALTRDPDSYEGRMVQILLKTLDNKATVNEIRSLLARNPTDGRLLFALGTTWLSQMEMDKAETIFLKLADIWPAFYENWLSLGWCYLLKNNLNQSLLTFEKAIALDEGIADGFAGGALVHALNKDTEKAQEYLQKAYALDPDCELVKLTQLILANAENPKEAARQFQTMFPQAASDLNQYLMRALLTSISSEGKTIH